MKMKVFLASAILILAAMGVLVAQEDSGHPVLKKPFGQPYDKGSSNSTTPTILYHGGQVLGTNGANIYALYYGNFPSTTTAIVNRFFSSLGSTPEYNVNTTYYQNLNGVQSNIVNALTLTAVYNDTSYFLGTNIGNNGPVNILQNAFAKNQLPVDPGGIYFVMTSPDVKVPGFCTSFCAYHTASTAIVSGVSIRYAFVPDPGSSLSGKCGPCDGNFAVYGETATPNGDAGADEMTDSIMHELSETVTDPDLKSWHTQNGAENGDLCNFNYGATYLVPAVGSNTPVHANFSVGKYNYLIQTIWPEFNGACLNKYPSK
jgi:hypothetical protein